MIIILDITLNTISFIDIDIRIWQFFDNTIILTTLFGFFFFFFGEGNIYSRMPYILCTYIKYIVIIIRVQK